MTGRIFPINIRTRSSVVAKVMAIVKTNITILTTLVACEPLIPSSPSCLKKSNWILSSTMARGMLITVLQLNKKTDENVLDN